MDNNPCETTHVLEKHPDVASRMRTYAAAHKALFYTTTKK